LHLSFVSSTIGSLRTRVGTLFSLHHFDSRPVFIPEAREKDGIENGQGKNRRPAAELYGLRFNPCG